MSFKPIFKSNEYEMKFYTYDPQEAVIEIKDDDALENELIEFLCSGSDAKYWKLRVVFEKNTHKPAPSPSSELQAPQLRLKRMRHYFFEDDSRIAISAEVEWNLSRDMLHIYPSAAFTFEIKENLKYKAHEYVSRVPAGKMCEVLSPLDANEEYAFQIKMFDEQKPSLAHSPWSDPLCVCTPLPPNRLPIPAYVQVTMLLPHIIELRWDTGFAPEPQHKATYIIKEHLQFAHYPFVAQYTIPMGKLSPLTPNTQYQFTLHTSYNGKDSAESAALAVVTPPLDFSEKKDYKPSPPIYVQQSIDEDYNEIVLFWTLPPNTFGNIHYIILDLPQHPHLVLDELPCRIPIPMQKTPIRIVTVTKINNQEYQSNPTKIVLQTEVSLVHSLSPKQIEEIKDSSDANTCFEWQITEHLLRQFKDAKHEKVFDSPQFKTIDGTIWKVQLYPHSKKSPEFCFIQLMCVELNSQKQNIGVNYSFAVKEMKWCFSTANTFGHKHQCGHQLGHSSAFKRDRLNNLDLMNIKCFVEETMDLSGANTYFEWKINNYWIERWKN
eukprot:821781_1